MIDEELKAKAEEYKATYKEEPIEESSTPQQAIQIEIIDGIPVLRYANMTPTEIIGALDICKTIITTTNIQTPLLKKNMHLMMQAL